MVELFKKLPFKLSELQKSKFSLMKMAFLFERIDGGPKTSRKAQSPEGIEHLNRGTYTGKYMRIKTNPSWFLSLISIFKSYGQQVYNLSSFSSVVSNLFKLDLGRVCWTLKGNPLTCLRNQNSQWSNIVHTQNLKINLYHSLEHCRWRFSHQIC